MITCNGAGNVIVTVDGKPYDLSATEQYAEFLIWITSPDERETIEEDAFEIDGSVPAESRDKAERYAEFLKAFARKRRDRLASLSAVHSSAERESEIRSFIERLEADRQ